MPPTLPLFDAAFQARQKARAAAWPNEPPPAFVREAEARLRERLEDLKTPPPDITLSCLALQNETTFPPRCAQSTATLPKTASPRRDAGRRELARTAPQPCRSRDRFDGRCQPPRGADDGSQTAGR